MSIESDVVLCVYKCDDFIIKCIEVLNNFSDCILLLSLYKHYRVNRFLKYMYVQRE